MEIRHLLNELRINRPWSHKYHHIYKITWFKIIGSPLKAVVTALKLQ